MYELLVNSIICFVLLVLGNTFPGRELQISLERKLWVNLDTELCTISEN